MKEEGLIQIASVVNFRNVRLWSGKGLCKNAKYICTHAIPFSFSREMNTMYIIWALSGKGFRYEAIDQWLERRRARWLGGPSMRIRKAGSIFQGGRNSDNKSCTLTSGISITWRIVCFRIFLSRNVTRESLWKNMLWGKWQFFFLVMLLSIELRNCS